MYLDESGFAVDSPRTHGYSTIGDRCYGSHNWNAKGRINAIGAQLGNNLITVSLIDGSVNSDVFHAWVEQDLLPKLIKSSVIVMDNASFHKREDTIEMIFSAGHILEYLPPYSPDLNPIEHKWAQAKAIRKRNFCDVDQLFSDLAAFV